ncbi:MAG TPA: E3 binding domain-containing protein [Solirubrobacterales bacterium]|nr:E3 binding domain-containing protein [Solirubrobacterales bacterium]
MASSEIIKATTSFTFTNASGAPVPVRAGETFHRDSARLEGLSEEALEGSFAPFVPDHDFEQATAAPGERRRPARQKSPQPQEPSEAAARLAEEHGIDLATVTGSGKDGRIIEPDVQALVDAASTTGEGAGGQSSDPGKQLAEGASAEVGK